MSIEKFEIKKNRKDPSPTVECSDTSLIFCDTLILHQLYFFMFYFDVLSPFSVIKDCLFFVVNKKSPRCLVTLMVLKSSAKVEKIVCRGKYVWV